MKRVGYLWEQVIDKENIRIAIRDAAKGKRGRPTVEWCLANEDAAIDDIREMLVSGSFIPSYPHVKTIIDQRRGKERLIACPRFYPDQVIHHALMQPLVPIEMRRMHIDSYGSMPGRGQHRAVKTLERSIRRGKGYKYVLQMDVRKCYQSITPVVVRRTLESRIKDARYVDEVMKIVELYRSGLPIGFYTSQWLANMVLDPLDHAISRIGGMRVIRYMDDVLVLCRNKRRLHRLRKHVAILLSEIGLSMKGNYQVFRHGHSRPICFLGCKVRKSHTRICSKTFLRITRRVRRACKHTPNTKDAKAILSYLGIIKHAGSQRMLERHVYTYVNVSELKGLVRNEGRIKHQYA
ncbi:MAG: hypothetical protein KBT28_12460 [Bacteroidales bacterium]|nr:hypothetical protein [Candidatus Colimorpha merdihippi]